MTEAESSFEIDWDDDEQSRYRQALLGWYDENHRELPWRQDVGPYGTWISEVMLQQTQVATVVDYYERWMTKFPTPAELAAASLDDVLKMWAGLGYYRRARFIHAAAVQIVEDGMPQTSKGWLSLPGVGRYTAGAIGSIALGEVVPVVDGNVKRVLSRFLAWTEDPTTSRSEKFFWGAAEILVDPERPGDFNQAVMELGATVCKPRNPACPECPLQESCSGFETGRPTDFPAPKRRKTKQRDETRHVALVIRDGSVWAVRTPPDGLLGGLWGFPEALSLEELAMGFPESEHADFTTIGQVKHVFSHIRMTYVAYLCEGLSLEPQTDASGWFDVNELTTLGMSRAMSKVAALLSSET